VLRAAGAKYPITQGRGQVSAAVRWSFGGGALGW